MYKLPELAELREMRERLGWTQALLARKSNVPRSIINRMETGVRRAQRPGSESANGQKLEHRYVPNYEAVKRIAECMAQALEREARTEEKLSIGKICTWNLRSVDLRDLVGHAREVMRDERFSELPVFDRGELRGRVKYGSVLEALEFLVGPDRAKLMESRLMDHPELIGPRHPCVDEWVGAMYLFDVVAQEGAVLVRRKGQIGGIATPEDYFKISEPRLREL